MIVYPTEMDATPGGVTEPYFQYKTNSSDKGIYVMLTWTRHCTISHSSCRSTCHGADLNTQTIYMHLSNVNKTLLNTAINK